MRVTSASCHQALVFSRSYVPTAHVTTGQAAAAICRDFAAWSRSGTIDQLSPAVVGRPIRSRLLRDAQMPESIG